MMRKYKMLPDQARKLAKQKREQIGIRQKLCQVGNQAGRMCWTASSKRAFFSQRCE